MSTMGRTMPQRFALSEHPHARPQYPAVVGLILACFAAVVVADVSPNAQAEEAFDPEDTVYATGAFFATEEELADVPRTPIFRNHLPEFVDLSDRFPPAGNQGKQGSCVAWAVGYAARSYYNSFPGGGSRLTASQVPSPAYIYDSIRQPGTSCDEGTYTHDALDLLKRGALTYAEYPYDEDLCRRPSDGMRARASSFRIADWLLVYEWWVDKTNPLDQVKGELARDHPVVIGLVPDREFERLRGRTVWRAGPTSRLQSGHAVTVVGYSERGQYFTFINSWGRGWGNKGYGRISYDTFRNRVKYGYVMRLTKPEPPKPDPPKPDPPKPEPPRPDPPKPEPPKPDPPKPDPPKPDPPKPDPPEPVVPDLVLPEIGCGRIAIEKRNGKQVVVGFVGSQEELARIQEAARKSKARAEVDLRPWPQCEALMTIEKPLEGPSTPAISLPKSSYRAEETLAFDVRMAGFQGYLHVAYIQADGNVVNLVESDALTLSTLPPNTELRFGDGLEGRSKFTVSAPFGNEMIVALASKSPLFDDDRPLVETEREFLTALRKAIMYRPDPTQPERVVTASYEVLQTSNGE